jgi:general secretion pathway protein C
MTAPPVRLVSFVCFALFCATLSFWIITLTTSNQSLLRPATAAQDTPVEIAAAAQLFGGQAEVARSDVKLAGVFVQRKGAAAIVSIADEPLRAVSLGQRIDEATRLVEVRLRSIIIERNAVKSEIFLPAVTEKPVIYVK